jgi:hypothetical protein
MQGISRGNQKLKTSMLKRAGHSRLSVQLIRQRIHARSEKRIGRSRRVAVRQQIDLHMEKREKYHYHLSEVTN